MMAKGVKNVLITDDSAIVRKRLVAMFSRIVNGEDISYAEDAAEAIDSIQELNPDAIILDIRMPGGSQMDVPPRIARSNQTHRVTAPNDYPHRQRRTNYADVGADFFSDRSTEFDRVGEVSKQLKHNQSRQ